jgi:L-aspartate oxidase
VHGANRLASNSLLEGLVFGARSGQAMIKIFRLRNATPLACREARSSPGNGTRRRARNPPRISCSAALDQSET